MEEENDQEKEMLEKKQKKAEKKQKNRYHSSQWVPYSEGMAWCWTG